MVRTIGKLAGRRQSETILPNKQPNEHQEEVGLLPALHLKQLYHLFLPWAADHYLKRTLMTTLQIQPVILPLPQPRKQKQKLQKYQKSKLKSQARCLVLPVSHFRFAGESLFFGKYFWNFGDGDSKEIQTINSRQFIHTYFYPGEYIVSLDYFQNYYSDVPDASDQITIKIIPADILISRVGDEKDFFVELRNNTDYTADLSNWILTSDRKSFTIPRNTVLATEKTITISPRITNFSIEDKNTLKLMTPQQEIAFDYTASVVPVKTTTPSIPPPKGEVKNSPLPAPPSPSAPLSLSRRGVGGEVNFEVAPASVPDNQPPADNLTASVAESDVVDSKNSRTIIIFAIFIIFIGISASVVYFVRSKGDIFRHGNDFKILDE